MEKFPNNEKSREGSIKARAFFDARGYIDLMMRESPDSLDVVESGDIAINITAGEEIINNAVKRLNLDVQESLIYLEFLKEAVKDILNKKM